MVNFNGLSDTVECLESLASIGDSDIATIVVDNASREDEAKKIADQFDWVTVIASPVNTGWSGGNNIGIHHALDPMAVPEMPHWRSAAQTPEPADIVFLLNNDTVVDPTIFKQLRYAFEQGYEVVGPVINEYADREQVQTEGVRFNPGDSLEFFQPIHLDQQNPDQVTSVDIVNGCAVAISRQVFDKIGLIDERFFLIGEESDFCLRAQAAGFRLGVLHQSLVFHKHSVSFNRAGKPLQRYYSMRNLWLLLNRHSGVRGRKGLWRSRLDYLRHAYHIYCHEKELGNQEGATAVMIGVADAFLKRLGPQPIKAGWLSQALDFLAGTAWRARGGSIETAISGSAAATKP